MENAKNGSKSELQPPVRGWRGDLTFSDLIWLLLRASRRVHRAQNEVSTTSGGWDLFSMGRFLLNTPVGGPKVPPELRFDLNRILLAKTRLIQPNLSPEHPTEKFWKIAKNALNDLLGGEGVIWHLRSWFDYCSEQQDAFIDTKTNPLRRLEAEIFFQWAPFCRPPTGGFRWPPKLGLEKKYLILTLKTYPEIIGAVLKNAVAMTIDPYYLINKRYYSYRLVSQA